MGTDWAVHPTLLPACRFGGFATLWGRMTKIPQPRWLALTLLLCASVFSASAQAESIPDSLLGDWTLEIESGEAGWLSISETDEGQPSVSMMVNVGSIKPLKGVEVRGGKVHVPLKGSTISSFPPSVKLVVISPFSSPLSVQITARF
jgi:hypothetical protein